ncbi:MAG TPA: hypothetical protein VIQ28_00370 [Burkholderiales bacterium]
MAEYVTAWQCIGCGKIEAPQTCIGVCRDIKVEFVYAAEHAEVVARMKKLEGLAQRLAWATPRDGEWERSYRTLQEEARRVLGSLADVTSAASAA